MQVTGGVAVLFVGELFASPGLMMIVSVVIVLSATFFSARFLKVALQFEESGRAQDFPVIFQAWVMRPFSASADFL